MVMRALAISLALVFVASGCKKKETVADTGPTDMAAAAPTTQDTNVQSKDLSLDAQGSDSGNINGLYTVHFDYDKSAISPEGRDLLQKDAEWIKGNPGVTVQIEGHCDRHGSIEYNLALGERRAKAVKAYLANLGVPKKRMTTISYGKEKPLDSAETDSADSKNRRANFVPQK